MSVFYPLDTVRFRLQCKFVITKFMCFSNISHNILVEVDSELAKKSTLQTLYHIIKEEGL